MRKAPDAATSFDGARDRSGSRAPFSTGPTIAFMAPQERECDDDAGLAAVEDGSITPFSRRDLLSLIGTLAGSAAMYHAMTSLGFASDSVIRVRSSLTAMRKGASVLILGAGLAGMTAALELRKAGYKVQILEFNSRPGGRNWTLRGGDTFTELGGIKQTCEFEQGLYFNPGPWRIPYHHRARPRLLQAPRTSRSSRSSSSITMRCCMPRARSAASRSAFATSKPIFRARFPSCSPRRPRRAGLMKRSRRKIKEILLQALQVVGRAGRQLRLQGQPDFRRIIAATPKVPAAASVRRRSPASRSPLSEILKSRLWRYLQNFASHTISDHDVPAGRRHGHDRQGVRQGSRRHHSLRRQGDADPAGRRRRHRHLRQTQRIRRRTQSPKPTGASAPFRSPSSVKSRSTSARRMKAAIDAVPYPSAVKIGLQFKRRFWEEDEAIYGGISYTEFADPADRLSEHRLQSQRPRRVAGRLRLRGLERLRIHVDDAGRADRARRRVRRRAFIRNTRPSSKTASPSPGIACRSRWAAPATGASRSRAQHYDDLCQIDGRIVLAGEHASYIPAWQEGAILSSLDAITRLHERVVKM